MNKPTHTSPWMKDEYIHVDGKPYVYTVGLLSNGITVRIPGRAAVPLNDLIQQGRNISMPKVIRRLDTD